MKKCDKCEPFETGFIANCTDKTNCIYGNTTNKVWDDKFGLMEDKKINKVIEGVGEDAEVITNEAGGKQSKTPMAMHLVDPRFLHDFYSNKADELEYLDEGDSTVIDPKDSDLHSSYRAITYIANMMLGLDRDYYIQAAMDALGGDDEQQIIKVATILQYGADRYEPNNWRLIPEESHINHALIHIIAHIVGDTQDEHIDHALCRLMMAYATQKSENFDYNTYIPKGK
jgi:hypothetical protein